MGFNRMNILKLAALAALMSCGAAVAQDVEKKMEIKIIMSDDSSGETSTMHWSSEDMGFDMQDLAVGETRTIESGSGKTVTVTRAEDGFSFDIDGKTIDLPDMGGHGTHMAFIGDGNMHENMNIDVEVINDMHIMQAHHPEGVTIISGKPLDDSVRDSIRSVLISAGNNEEVTFVDSSAGGKRVMIREIEIVE
jgi:hypothetical protein